MLIIIACLEKTWINKHTHTDHDEKVTKEKKLFFLIIKKMKKNTVFLKFSFWLECFD